MFQQALRSGASFDGKAWNAFALRAARCLLCPGVNESTVPFMSGLASRRRSLLVLSSLVALGVCVLALRSGVLVQPNHASVAGSAANALSSRIDGGASFADAKTPPARPASGLYW
jgi:hypothetical protein